VLCFGARGGRRPRGPKGHMGWLAAGPIRLKVEGKFILE
jgi:hypothetical protein